MEIKTAYPIATPEKSSVLLTRKGSRKYENSGTGNEGRDVIPQNRDIEDIVDITTDDIIHIDLTHQKSTRSLRDSSAITYTAVLNSKEKGTVIDTWA